MSEEFGPGAGVWRDGFRDALNPGWRERAREQAAQAFQRNYARSFLPGPDEISVLEAAGIPARGPLQRWAPTGPAPRTRVRQEFTRDKGTVYTPGATPSRWLGVNERTGAAMRTPNPISQRTQTGTGRERNVSVQPMHLENYGGERDPRFLFSSPFNWLR